MKAKGKRQKAKFLGQFVILFSLTLLPFALPLWSCPFCKDVLSASNARLATGFYWSILFMLGVVFSVVGVIIGVIVKAQRTKAQE